MESGETVGGGLKCVKNVWRVRVGVGPGHVIIVLSSVDVGRVQSGNRAENWLNSQHVNK